MTSRSRLQVRFALLPYGTRTDIELGVDGQYAITCSPHRSDHARLQSTASSAASSWCALLCTTPIPSH